MSERSPLYTPTRFFLVLLRLAIGWHFLYEGWSKLETYLEPTRHGPSWSAEGYLRNANGPAAPYFRRLLEDADGVDRLTLPVGDDKTTVPPGLAKHWDEVYAQFLANYDLKEEQRREAAGKVQSAKKAANDWLRANQAYIGDYLNTVQKSHERDGRPLASFEKDRAFGDQHKGLQAQRNYLLGKVDEWTADLKKELDKLIPPEKLETPTAKPTLLEWNRITDWPAWWTPLDWVNFATVYGLIAMGLCLMFGFFTRLAALGAFLFLASLYMVMPPWPGLPGATANNGHYFYVNLQAIEAIAVLAVAGSGRWAGIDALLHWPFSGSSRQAPPPARMK